MKKKNTGIKVFAIIGILLTLFYLIFVGLSINLVMHSFQLKGILLHFLGTIIVTICLGVCAIFVLKYKNWARIMYLIFIGLLLLMLWRNIAYLYTMSLFSYGFSLSREIESFVSLIALPLGVINIFSLIVAFFFFSHPKVKEQFK